MNSRTFTIAAVLIGAALSVLPSLSANDLACPRRPRMEVAFVLDTTGSMTGMIAGAKRKIWAIANKLKSAQPTPEISFGLVGYRDRGDAYVTKVYGLTTNLDEVYAHLNAFEAQGGGDEPESVNEALFKAVRDMQWSSDPDVLRIIFLVGDARPHMDYQDDVKYPETCKLANRKGILINTLQCGHLSGTEAVWRKIAAGTNGTYCSILENGGTIKIDTPYDQQIKELNIRLNGTIILYGTHAQQTNASRNAAVMGSLSSEAIGDRASYFAKSEPGAVVTGDGDLVVDVMNGRQRVDDIEKDKLDPTLQSLSVEDRNKLIAQKVGERKQIQTELNDLVAKRDALVAKKMKEFDGTEGALELNAFQVLEKQASDKGFRFEKEE